jgi:hypothetical protein
MENRTIPAAIEALEPRSLMATVFVGDFGAVPDDGGDDRAAVQAAINAAGAGDTVQFGAGRYDLAGTLNVRGGRTYNGAGRLDTLLKFNVGSNGWGMRIEGNASGARIENFRFEGGGIALDQSGTYRNITIARNDFAAPAPGTFNNTGTAIFQAFNSDGLVIDNNRFHDWDKYGLIVFGVDRMRLVNNVFKNLYQGAHILNPGEGNTIANNRLTGLVRMGFEVQRHGSRTASNTLVERNVITHWRRVFNDSFGLSIVPDGSVNTVVRDNYIQLPGSRDGVVWERPKGERRGGYGIEFGAKTGSVSGNVIGGIFANHIVISGGGGLHNTVIPVSNNRMYGIPLWGNATSGWIVTESFGGKGFGWSDVNNTREVDYARMPPPTLLRGDADNDGVVGLGDLAVLRGAFGSAGGPAHGTGFGGVTFSDGDFDGDGRVTLRDYNLLAAAFNAGPTTWHGPVDLRLRVA